MIEEDFPNGGTDSELLRIIARMQEDNLWLTPADKIVVQDRLRKIATKLEGGRS